MTRTAFSMIACVLISCALAPRAEARKQAKASYNIAEPEIFIRASGIKDTVKLFVISDTHLFLSDERENPYRQYSKRMSRAYNKTTHAHTGEPTNPEAAFDESLVIAREFGADAILHLGDLVSYPSEYGVEYAIEHLNATGIPWYYIEGNHDWHYEGMGGTETEMREEWSAKRLSPLYQGRDHLNYSVEVKGLKLIFVSNGTNEILPSQVQFLKKELKGNKPSLLLTHVPFYTPGRPDRQFTIGNPNWNASVDVNWKVEKRDRWPEEGHAQADYDFYNAVFNNGAKHGLLATLSGHVHFFSCSIQGGIPSITVDDNASCGYCRVTVLPL